MHALSVTYASSPSSDLLIPTLEFNNETAGVIRLAQSFNDVTATTELAETVTFIESAWDVSLPNKDATGQQTLQLQLGKIQTIKPARISLCGFLFIFYYLKVFINNLLKRYV